MHEEVSLNEEWTDAEIATFQRRAERLVKDGLNEMEAEQLAERMLLRDRPVSGDDRRICLECKNLKRRVCTRARAMGLPGGMEPVRTILQRCHGFVLRGAQT